MLIGIVGKPSTGKSSLFNALTHGHAAVASYPFTTIDPNKGVAFVRVRCACSELGVTCKPRFGSCTNGVRLVPINVVDVAGLVEGAHEGRGKGNQFLNDLHDPNAQITKDVAQGTANQKYFDNRNTVNPAGWWDRQTMPVKLGVAAGGTLVGLVVLKNLFGK